MAIALSPLVGTWFQVLFHSPRRGSFHCSVALLFTIGRQVVLSLGRWASLLHTAFHGNRATRGFSGRTLGVAYGAITLFGRLSSPVPLPKILFTPWVLYRHPRGPHNPCCTTAVALHATRFGLFRVRSPLLTESRFSLLSYGYLDVSVPRVGSYRLWIQQ